LFCRIREFNKSFGAVYWHILKRDGHIHIVLAAMAAGLCATYLLKSYLDKPLAFLVIAPAFAIGMRAFRHVLNDGARKLPNRPFTLYLRPFLSDRKLAFDLGTVFRYRDAPLSGGMGRDVHAIGSPHDSFPRNLGLNVALTWASDETWQSVVTDLIARADHIWIYCTLEEWVQWEIRQVLTQRKLTAIGFILPPKRRQEVWASVLAGAPARQSQLDHLKQRDMTFTMYVCFAADGSSIFIESQSNSADDYLPGIYAARYALLHPLRRR
jgi:hypothetical protein